MGFRALVYAYVLGGLTFVPLVLLAAVFFTIYTSVPVGDSDPDKPVRTALEDEPVKEEPPADKAAAVAASSTEQLEDIPRTRKGWLTVRRTFEESESDGSYVTMVRGFLDARSKDPKRSRPKDQWYVALKGTVMYLYEDEAMTECEAAVDIGAHEVIIYPERQPDGELFTKRNAICLKPRVADKPKKDGKGMPSVTKEMKLEDPALDERAREVEERQTGRSKRKEKKKEDELEKIGEVKEQREAARAEALDAHTPWFIFVRSNVEMEDWYLSLIHASEHPAHSPTLMHLQPVFKPVDMARLVSTLDAQPDVIPMRWLNALIGRVFFSFYRTKNLEAFIVGRLMKKLAKVKRPSFLSDVVVKEVSVGSVSPTLSKPMLKELTREGDCALEVRLHYKGEVRITVEATATINLGARFKTYTVKLVLAVVLRELEGNLLIKVKRPPSSRIWYAFTQPPRMVLDVEPVVSDRQITWSMILSTMESRLKEIIQESIVLPNMDDIAFFESSGYEHRGGIWADAKRTSISPEGLSPEEAAEGAEPDAVTAPSEPAAPSSTEDGLHATSDDLPLAERQMSAPLPNTETRAESTSFSTSEKSGSTSALVSSLAKRKTWFNNLRNDGSTDSESTLPPIDEPPERGRSTDVHGMPPRAQSTPADASSIPEIREDISADVGSPVPASSRPSSSQRSGPSNPTTPEVSPSRSSSRSRPITEPPTPAAPPKTPPPQSRVSSGATSSSSMTTSSFLSTLKSRDKQALQASAKEAIRKWGVNWSSLRRNSIGDEGEDTADAGPSEHERQRMLSDVSHKSRPSYAELRAKVADRWAARGEPEPTPTGGSAPIAIPDNSKTRESLVSHSSASSSGNPSRRSSVLAGLSVSPGSLSRTSSGLDGEHVPKAITPSSPRPVSQMSPNGRPDAQENAGTSTPEVSRPIFTQPPQARTMTIPGIHASHRGEVQSLGYAPPVPAAPMDNGAKGKAPALLNRLWKAPGTAAPGMSDANGTAVNVDAEAGNPSGPDVIPPAEVDGSSPEGGPRARPQPPPLPPRSASSSASAALKSIVSREERRRSGVPDDEPPSMLSGDGDGDDGGTGGRTAAEHMAPPPPPPPSSGVPPPLPPRQVRTSAEVTGYL